MRIVYKTWKYDLKELSAYLLKKILLKNISLGKCLKKKAIIARATAINKLLRSVTAEAKFQLFALISLIAPSIFILKENVVSKKVNERLIEPITNKNKLRFI